MGLYSQYEPFVSWRKYECCERREAQSDIKIGNENGQINKFMSLWK